MSVEYSAIAAKLKAMYSKFLTRDDYEQLLERKSVNDICSYLKSTPGYGEVLEQVNERDIHRGHREHKHLLHYHHLSVCHHLTNRR